MKKILSLLLALVLALSLSSCPKPADRTSADDPSGASTNGKGNTPGNSAILAGKLMARPETNGNLIQNQRLVGLDGTLYYFMPDGLHRMKEDGSENVLIYETAPINGRFQYSGGSLALVGDWIYVRDGDLLRMKSDGTELQTLIGSSELPRGSIKAIDDWLYIGSEYKCRLDGTELQQYDDINVASGYTWNISDGWVYRYDRDEHGEDCIYKLKPNGTQKEKIHSGRADCMIVDGEWIYYYEFYGDNCIYKMKTDGSDNQLIVEFNRKIMSLNLLDGWLYYSDDDENGTTYLYRVKTDGTDTQKLWTKDDAEYLGIHDIYTIGEWLYIIGSEYRNEYLYRMKPDGTDVQMIAEWVID